ncbi:hypothetical protein L345_10483, partial [Ophiophagus hannah]
MGWVSFEKGDVALSFPCHTHQTTPTEPVVKRVLSPTPGRLPSEMFDRPLFLRRAERLEEEDPIAPLPRKELALRTLSCFSSRLFETHPECKDVFFLFRDVDDLQQLKMSFWLSSSIHTVGPPGLKCHRPRRDGSICGQAGVLPVPVGNTRGFASFHHPGIRRNFPDREDH